MIFLYLLQPLFQKLTTRMSKRALAAVSGSADAAAVGRYGLYFYTQRIKKEAFAFL